MLKNLLKATLLLSACFLYFSAAAQTDTSYYDLGRTRIKKDFAQSITIKGEELEKLPATNLADALSVWISGVYTSPGNVVYVIDGDLVNDVNAYSVYDVKSATLIQNATGAINGLTQQRNMILISTRKGHDGASVFNVAGQTNLVNARGTDFPGTSSATYYHQYYLSAYNTVGNSHFGVSASYQHDASLSATTITASTINNSKSKFDAGKLYAFFDTQIGTGSVLNVTANYVPEAENYNSSGLGYTPGYNYSQLETSKTTPQLLNTKLSLTSTLPSNFSNVFSFNYNSLSGSTNASITTLQPGNNYLDIVNGSTIYRAFLVRDNLQYRYVTGDWTVEPSVNLNFRFTKENQVATSVVTSVPGGGVVAGQQNNFISEYKTYLLTPSVNIYYKNIFSLQGGVTAYLNSRATDKSTSSFVSLSADILRMTTAPDSYDWKVFASYANFGNFYDYSASTAGFDQTPLPAYFSTVPVFVPIAYTYVSSFNNYQAGTVVSFFNNKLSVDYDYEKRQSIVPVSTIAYPSGLFSGYIFPLDNSEQHRIGVTANVIGTTKFKWFTTVNTTHIVNSYTFNYQPIGVLYATPFSDSKVWTGGWVNRLELGKVKVGADMLYLSGSTLGIVNGNVAYTTNYTRSFLLQNAYVSYPLQLKGFKGLEVYANTRNLAQNATSNITDSRKFWGVGFKAGF